MGMIALSLGIAYLIVGLAFAAMVITDDGEQPDNTQLVVTAIISILIGPGLLMWLRIKRFIWGEPDGH